MPAAPATSDVRDDAARGPRGRPASARSRSPPRSATADLERQIDPLMSPLVWDLAHIAAYEDLWLVHRHADLPLLRADLAATYDAFETPRAVRGDVELLDTAGALEYLAAVRERALAADRDARRRPRDPRARPAARAAARGDDAADAHARPARRLRPAVPRGAARLAGAGRAQRPRVRRPSPAARSRSAPAPGRFSYDNERPPHVVTVAPFRIARTPVTNASWLAFAEGGGYERREWWTDEAWAWKEQEDITGPLHWARRPDGSWCELTACGPRDLDPDRPVCHVSWFEAAAFARAHGARLPTEAEWETAATWAQRVPMAGDEAAHVGQRAFETAPVGAVPQAAADCGALDLIGNVWEWTQTEFDGYPGFAAHPYREYSEVFFRRGYRVLRGGSWATQSRVATPTFRNWDLPQRRQIFAGVRLAIDEEHA